MAGLLILAVAIAVFVLVSPFNSSSTTERVTISNVANTTRKLSPAFSGFSVNAYTGTWHSRRFVPAVRRLRPESLRGYPGGISSNYINWQTGQYFIDGNGHNFVKQGRPKPPDSLPTFVRTLQAVHALPIFTLNIMTYCPADRARPVSNGQARPTCSRKDACGPDPALYSKSCTNPDLTWGLRFELRLLETARQHGLPIRYVELGNELYNSPDSTYFFPTVQRYIAKANLWIKAIKGRFPDAQVAVVGFSGNTCVSQPHRPAALAHREDGWTSAVARGVEGEAALAFHIYYASRISSPGTVSDTSDAAIMLSTAAQSCSIRTQKQVLDRLPHHVAAWITEWNLAPTPGVLEYGSWAQGLSEAAYAVEMARQPKVLLIENNTLISTQIFGALLGGGVGTEAENHPVLTPDETLSHFGFPAKIQQYSRSGGGFTLSAFNRSARGANRTGGVVVRDSRTHESLTSARLLAQQFTVGERHNLFFVNLSPTTLRLDLGPLSGRYSRLQYSADPGTFVFDEKAVARSVGAVHENVVLPPHSATSLVEGPSP